MKKISSYLIDNIVTLGYKEDEMATVFVCYNKILPIMKFKIS